jgi:hypothetical protein
MTKAAAAPTRRKFQPVRLTRNSQSLGGAQHV